MTTARLRNFFSSSMRSLSKWLESLGDCSEVIVCSPPPPKSRSHVLVTLEKEDYFRNLLDKCRASGDAEIVLDDIQRVAIYKNYVSELESISAVYGATFLPAPPDALDSEGTLKLEFSADDCTHANGLYGKLVLEQLSNMSKVI